MGMIATVVGCLLGVLTYLLIGLVTPIDSWGAYSTGILVALCLIWTGVIGAVPLTLPWRKQ